MPYLSTIKVMKVKNNTHKARVRTVLFFASWCGESVCVELQPLTPQFQKPDYQ